MINLTLYQIAAEHRAMVDKLMETNDDAQSVADTIEAESYPLETKAQNVAYAKRNLEATAAAIKEAEGQMATRRKSIENKAAHLGEYLLTCMQIANISKIECPHFAISIRTNPAKVDVFEPGLVPAEYMRTPPPPPPEVDKTAVKAAIAVGKEIPGVKLVNTYRVEIK